ncbi:MAG: transglutaminase domain-containing protein, partial [Terriglobales bacterium]
GKSTTLARIQAIAAFVQADIRYVAIELGIGGWQPHPAADVFAWRYGDCKDKATLMVSMLREIGIDSFYVVINTERGAVSPTSQPQVAAFNHAVIAIKLPDDVKDNSLYAVMFHPQLGRLLFFDPTNELTPLGEIGGYLQANYGLVVGGDGGQLLELPTQPTDANGIHRTAKLTLASNGTLEGNFTEVRIGDRAAQQRATLRSVTSDADRVKPVEQLLSHAFSTFQITHASVDNLSSLNEPFGYRYSVVAPGYAKAAGELLLVRARVVGSKASTLLDTKEPRRFPVVFDSLVKDTDSFEIAIPPAFAVDDLPASVDADYSFASYHSKTDFTGGVLRYTRTFELKTTIVPLDKMEDLKNFYRLVNSDERSTAVLRRITK